MDKIKRHKELCNELNLIYEAKNADYGDSFGKGFEEYGDLMAIIRIEDKLNRYKNLIKNPQKVNDEAIEDTLKDLADYSLMTIVEREKRAMAKGE